MVSIQTDHDTPLGVHISTEMQLVREAVRMMYDPAFILRGKSDKGEAGKAENQAYRSGAVLVNAAGILCEKIWDQEANGADPVPLSSLRPYAPM